jgi:sulfate-transporting ATPase
MSTVWQYLLLALAFAPAYVILGQSMVVTTRGSGAVNFAAGAFAMVGGWVCEDLETHIPLALAVTLGIVAAALMGALTHILVMRSLARAQQLTRVIATLGVAIVGQTAIILVLGDQTEYPVQLFSQRNLSVFGASVSVSDVIMFVIAVALSGALWGLYRFTTFGRQTTAVAEDQRTAAARGISPDMIGLANWTLAGALAGVAGVLVTPVIGLSSSTLPLLLVPALAAGLLGNFSSFWLTLLGGTIVGVGESELTRYSIGTGWPESFGFLVIAVVLVFRSGSLPERGAIQARLPAIGLGRIRPRLVVPALVVACIVAGVLPGSGPGAVQTTAATAIVLLSIVVVTGYAGQISLAQLGLAGFGALVASRASQDWGLTFWLCLPIGVLATLPLSVLVGLPALRARGVNLAIVTLGLGLVIQDVVLSDPTYTGGLSGVTVGAPTIFGFNLDPEAHPGRYAVLCILILAVCAVAVANLRRGRVGRQLIAVRGNERAAAALGISLTATKLYAFAVAAAVAAVGGVLLAFSTSNVLFSQFNTSDSITLLGFVVVGGIGFVGGSIVGGIAAAGGLATWIFGELFPGPNVSNWIALAGGVGVLMTIIQAPDGIAADMIMRSGRLIARFRRSPAAPDEVSATDGGSVTHARVERSPDCLLTVDAVGLRFGGVVALADVSFTVRSGEVMGLVGPNGAGKTTMIDAISGISRGYTGSVTLNERSLDRAGAARRSRLGIGRSFQSIELFEDLSVEENLRVASDKPRPHDYLRDLVLPKRPPLSGPAAAAVQEFGLADVLDRKPSELPYGQRRLVGIARAVAATPAVLLLDEPAAGLDDGESAELAHLLKRLAREWNFAVLLVEHNMDLVMAACDRITALDFGRVIAAGAADAVRSDPAFINAYVGAGAPADRDQANGAFASPHGASTI